MNYSDRPLVILALILVLFAGCMRPAPLTSDLPASPPSNTTPVQLSSPSPRITSSHPASAPPSPQLSGSATPQNNNTAAPTKRPRKTATPILRLLDRVASESISPAEEWADTWFARIVVAYPNETSPGEFYHVQLDLVRPSNETWTIVDEWRPYGLGVTSPAVMHWSNDGRYLFIADQGVPDGCGPAFSQNLRRVDLSTMEMAPLDIVAWGSLAISPDGKTLASFGEGQVLFTDLETGEVIPIPFDRPQAEYWPGGITWSPDSTAILFTPQVNPCGPSETRASAIMRTGLTDRRTTTLLQPDPRELSIQSWPLEDLAQLADPEGEVFWLQVSTGQISAEPPEDIGTARQALFAFFEALSSREYATAAEFYRGSYEILVDHNPGIDPDDLATLWQSACTINGAVCLPVLSAVLEGAPNPGEYRFSVAFDDGGEPFVLGPCCGADLADEPPRSIFEYTVTVNSQGVYQVTGLPVYQP
jgi:hypothetical protein